MAKTTVNSSGGSSRHISRGGKSYVTDESKLQDLMGGYANGFISKVARGAAQTLKRNTANLVYDDYAPKKYQRTFDMLNCIYGPGFNGGERVQKIGAKNYRAEVGFDLDRMRLIPKRGSTWGKHVGWSDEDAREAVIEGFEENGFFILGKKAQVIYDRPPVHMIEKTYNDISDTLDSIPHRIVNYDYLDSGIVAGLIIEGGGDE